MQGWGGEGVKMSKMSKVSMFMTFPTATMTAERAAGPTHFIHLPTVNKGN